MTGALVTMKVQLTIQEKLKDLRVERRLTLEELEAKVNISKSTLGSYENDEYKHISHTNLMILAKFYGVSIDYLVGLSENRTLENTALADLHIDDKTVQILSNGRINNRLLCELINHENFIKLMADIEIYVDGIANMQIQNLNTMVDSVRQTIIKKYQPNEDDYHLQLLQVTHINDDEYFNHMVSNDLHAIIKDIREAHKKDSDTAPETTIADELKKDLEDAANFKGSPLEKQAVLYCKRLGINYSKLSPDEFQTLIKILKKSTHLKTPINQKKRRK